MNLIRKLLQEIADNRREVVCLSRKDRLDLDDHAELSRMNRRRQDLEVTLETAMREFAAKVDNILGWETTEGLDVVYEALYNSVKQ